MKTQVPPLKQLTRRELAAWRGFLRLHAALVRELDRELEEVHGLPLTHYEVLLHLQYAPGHRMRMSDLASSVLLSQSGVTRLVDRLEEAGHVVRGGDADDQQGVALDAGRQRPGRLVARAAKLRGGAWGYVLAPAVLTCAILLGVGIVAAMGVLRSRGEAASLGVAGVVTGLTIVEGFALVVMLDAILG